MTITMVLCLADGGPGGDSAIKSALEVGQAFAAHVEILHIGPPDEATSPIVVDGMAGSAFVGAFEGLRDRAARRRENVETQFSTLCEEGGVTVIQADDTPKAAGFTAALRVVKGHENREIAWRGKLADLIVVGPPDDESGGVDSMALEAALLDTGRPVLMSDRPGDKIIGGHVTIGWDGSREAALSIDLAMPILKRAHAVEVVTIGASEEAGPEAIVGFLNRHGIAAQSRRLDAGEVSVAECLLEESKQNGARLLVMGAYGHSTFSEYVFGGVTRHAMTAADVPLFLAH